MSNERCTIVGFDIGRPFDHSLFAPDLTPIYELCHSRKSINRALILHKRGGGVQARSKKRRGEEKEEEKEEKEEAPPRPPPEPCRTTVGASPDHRQSLAGPPSELRRTTAGVLPHHHLKV
ncbi:hypothetical protein MA16_Dca027681 [Dendrobium catenatum]|uniref:Uncharacterized protein n=1 Tax=Dendrobium catenatum TaxID=906689 RepID=A0A2I0VAD3_9ASPA|nr:hypothetical protein MA16_Dca027681 [Dendrobium catenatum]